jgi:hypothetical protein
MKRQNQTTSFQPPTTPNRKEDTASEDSTGNTTYMELPDGKKQKNDIENEVVLHNKTSPTLTNGNETQTTATPKVKPKSPTKKTETPITFSVKKKQYVTKVYSVGASYGLLIVKFRHGTNFNEDGFIKPFKDFLDTPKGAEVASDLRIIQVCLKLKPNNSYFNTNLTARLLLSYQI